MVKLVHQRPTAKTLLNKVRLIAGFHFTFYSGGMNLFLWKWDE